MKESQPDTDLLGLTWELSSITGWGVYGTNVALEILKRISDDDCEKLGLDPRFCRPDWMVLTVLPVPPQQALPPVAPQPLQPPQPPLSCLPPRIKVDVANSQYVLKNADDDTLIGGIDGKALVGATRYVFEHVPSNHPMRISATNSDPASGCFPVLLNNVNNLNHSLRSKNNSMLLFSSVINTEYPKRIVE